MDQEKIDYWVFHFSKAVQKNLAPYLSKCNIRVSPPIKEQLELYPSWILGFLERERGKTKNYTLGHVPNV
ncbi:unknown [Odoribacter laneus CAG:561]|nr:unknown [Odoribacter laneus CAG:561]